MMIKFYDSTNCNIELDSENSTERILLRDIYLKLIEMTDDEKNECLARILGVGSVSGKRFKLTYVNLDDEPFQKRKIYDTSYNKEYDCTLKHQEDLCNLLNEQDMNIFLLKTVIQTITAEAMNRGSITEDRIKEIKHHWYQKLYD